MTIILEDCKTLVFDKQTTKVFLITCEQNECLSIKGAEQLRIPSARFVFLVLDIIEVVRSIVEHSGDNEGTFPGRSQLVWFLLIHSENQVSLLKCPTPHVSGVESMLVLLIDGRSDQGHLSFLFQEVNCILTCLFCFFLCEKLDSGCIVEHVTRKYNFGSINQEKWGSASRPIGSCPQSPQY